jgi:teichuronic acid biosynthesis glycosyltransferase TuaH
MRSRERQLLEHAAVVVACSLGLTRQLRERTAAPVVYIPHACDEVFLEFDASTADEPPELRGLPRPIIGYVGNVNARIDARLLAATCRATESLGGTMVVIGGRFTGGPPIGADLASILARPAVIHTGEKRPAELPPYMAALDVGVTPYLDDEFNRKSYPLKIPQYLGVGAAVVSTPNGATEELGGLVRTATEPDDFARAVVAAAGETGRGARAARRGAVADRTWLTVANELIDACSGLLPR